MVDHRVGAGQTIGINLTAQATPDGYTMAVVNPSHAISATLMPKLPYDPLRDLAVVTMLATQPYALIVANSLPAHSVKEFIALAKAKPRELNMASSGNGSASHLGGELFMLMSGVQMTHVPYKGTGGAMPDLVAGRAHFYVNPMLAMIADQGGPHPAACGNFAHAHRLDARSAHVAESLPGYEATSWYMILMPVKTPPAIIAKVHDQTVLALKSPDIVDVLAKGGSEPVGNGSKEATAFLETEIDRWGKVIRQAMVNVQ